MKKIMFNDKYGLTQAVLDGRKTMTRRLIPKVGDVNDINWGIGNNGKTMITIEAFSWDGLITEDIYPQYQVGEVVAVAQSYETIAKEDFTEGFTFDYADWVINCRNEKGWSNKMFVKSDLMPHQIRIENIRVERLRDISSADCLAEGILKKSDFPNKKTCPFYFAGGKHEWDNSFHTPRQAYAALIDKISGKGTWERNPWVYVYDFKLIK